MPRSAKDPSQLQAEALYSNTKLFLNTSARHLLLLTIANPPAPDEAVGDLSPSPCSGGSQRPCSPQRLQQWGLTPTVLFYKTSYTSINGGSAPPRQSVGALPLCLNQWGLCPYASISGGVTPMPQSVGDLPCTPSISETSFSPRRTTSQATILSTTL